MLDRPQAVGLETANDLPAHFLPGGWRQMRDRLTKADDASSSPT